MRIIQLLEYAMPAPLHHKNPDYISSYCITQTGSTGYLQSFWQYFWLLDIRISWKHLNFMREGRGVGHLQIEVSQRGPWTSSNMDIRWTTILKSETIQWSCEKCQCKKSVTIFCSGRHWSLCMFLCKCQFLWKCQFLCKCQFSEQKWTRRDLKRPLDLPLILSLFVTNAMLVMTEGRLCS